MIDQLLHWVASDPYGQAAGFLCVLSVPFTILIVSHRRGSE